MSLKQFMHPRNIYRNAPDFKQLAIQFPEFCKYVTQDLSGKVHLDFKNPDALRALTTSLLQKDFGINVDIPSDHLVPTLPLRLNYIHWLEDLLAVASLNIQNEKIHGIDIGTGATCIYPLLGSKMNKWSFLATEINEDSFQKALANVAKNNLQGLIEVVHVSENTILFDLLSPTREFYHFTMCNPPFFSSEVDANSMGKSRKPGRSAPRSINTAIAQEGVVEGGEFSFVSRLIEDSLKTKNRVRVYTTMLGKKHTLGLVKNALQSHGIQNFTTAEFCQGKTTRWGIAWSFHSEVQLSQVDTVQVQKRSTNKPMVYIIPKQDGIAYSVTHLLERVVSLLADLKVAFTEINKNKNLVSLKINATEDTWSHQRRKRRAQQYQKPALTDVPPDMDDLELQSKKAKADHNSPDDAPNDVSNEDWVQTKEGISLTNTSSLQVNDKNDDANREAEIDYGRKKCVLCCLLTLKKVGSNIILELIWVEGELGRDAMHQVLQYFKNRLT